MPMRKTFLVAALLVLASPGVHAQNTAPQVLSIEAEPGSVDLIEDAGSTFAIHVEAKDDDSGDRVFAVEVSLQGPAPFVVDGSRVRQDFNLDPTGRTWNATIDVDDPRLVTGTYAVTVKVFDRNGAVAEETASGLISVTASAVGSHPLRVGVFDDQGISQASPADISLGSGEALRLDVAVAGAQTLVGQVVFSITHNGTTTQEVPLARPYVLDAVRFNEGSQQVDVRVDDRAGRSKTVSFDVLKDTVDPVFIAVVPTITYQGVNFTASVLVDDASPYTVFVQLEDQEVQASSEGSEPVSFELGRDALGRTNLVFTVVDDLGNVATQVRNITTDQAIADTEVALEILEPFPLPEQPVTFRLTVSQDGGVTTIPVDALVTLPGVGKLYDQSLDVPIGGERVETFQATLRPGLYEANATVSVGPLINETDESDQTALRAFEVFLGKVVRGDDAYYIRVDGRGQPVQAVSTGGAQHDLRLNETSGRTLYEFTVQGDTLFWDPAQRTTTIEEPADPPKEESPGLPWLLLAALLAGFAWRRRD